MKTDRFILSILIRVTKLVQSKDNGGGRGLPLSLVQSIAMLNRENYLTRVTMDTTDDGW